MLKELLLLTLTENYLNQQNKNVIANLIVKVSFANQPLILCILKDVKNLLYLIYFNITISLAFALILFHVEIVKRLEGCH